MASEDAEGEGRGRGRGANDDESDENNVGGASRGGVEEGDATRQRTCAAMRFMCDCFFLGGIALEGRTATLALSFLPARAAVPPFAPRD
jgi:hypothetical protein